jgi:hypothetical protein
MKISIIILLLLASVKSIDSTIEVKDLKKVYDFNDSLNFSILNKSNKKMFYRIGLDCYSEKEWGTVIHDISRPAVKSNTTIELKGLKKVKKSYLIKKIILFKDYKRFESYRLKIYYGDSVTNISKITYSEEFKIR